MGQKIHPIGFRMGIGASWQSRWFATSPKYRQFLQEDIKIRQLLLKKLRPAGIASVEIERAINKLKVIIFVSRPGVLIGRGGSGLTELKKFLLKELKIKDENSLEISPMELKSADLSAYLVAQSVAEQPEGQRQRRLGPRGTRHGGVGTELRHGFLQPLLGRQRLVPG